MSANGNKYDVSAQVAQDTHWVGFFDEEENFHCNPYLIIDDNEAVLIDPGSLPHFPIVMRKVIDLINPAQIKYIVAAHQDPDVCGSLAVVEDIIDRPDLTVVAQSVTARLIRHYGINSDIYRPDQHDHKLVLPSGRTLEFIETPFLHSPGAMMTYDTKTGSLFTSDIFGAISDTWDLYMDANFPESMRSWHQAIMPSNKLLHPTLDKIEQLNPNRILPQHGSMIDGRNISVAIEYLRGLPCGLDLKE